MSSVCIFGFLCERLCSHIFMMFNFKLKVWIKRNMQLDFEKDFYNHYKFEITLYLPSIFTTFENIKGIDWIYTLKEFQFR